MPIDREKVKRLRRGLGYTLEQAAERAGLSGRSHWNNIEAGRQDVTTGVLDKLAETLGVKPCDLLKPAPKPRKGK